jgi:hypothetical protein
MNKLTGLLRRYPVLIEKPRRLFNVKNEKDVDVYIRFLESGAWGTDGCPFVLEDGYRSIPEMLEIKMEGLRND